MKNERATISESRFEGIAVCHCLAPEMGKLLSAYVTSALDESREELFELHLLSCKKCREDYRYLSAMINTVRAYPGLIFEDGQGDEGEHPTKLEKTASASSYRDDNE